MCGSIVGYYPTEGGRMQTGGVCGGGGWVPACARTRGGGYAREKWDGRPRGSPLRGRGRGMGYCVCEGVEGVGVGRATSTSVKEQCQLFLCNLLEDVCIQRLNYSREEQTTFFYRAV